MRYKATVLEIGDKAEVEYTCLDYDYAPIIHHVPLEDNLEDAIRRCSAGPINVWMHKQKLPEREKMKEKHMRKVGLEIVDTLSVSDFSKDTIDTAVNIPRKKS